MTFILDFFLVWKCNSIVFKCYINFAFLGIRRMDIYHSHLYAYFFNTNNIYSIPYVRKIMY